MKGSVVQRNVCNSVSVTPRASNNNQSTGSNNKGREVKTSISKSPKR